MRFYDNILVAEVLLSMIFPSSDTQLIRFSSLAASLSMLYSSSEKSVSLISKSIELYCIFCNTKMLEILIDSQRQQFGMVPKCAVIDSK